MEDKQFQTIKYAILIIFIIIALLIVVNMTGNDQLPLFVLCILNGIAGIWYSTID